MSVTPQLPIGAPLDGADQSKLLGVYTKSPTGMCMQRVRVTGGRVKGGQWGVLADAARRFTQEKCMHLTTRQDIEFHGIPAADVPAVQAAIAEAGLSGHGACGDTVRNITLCPGGGLCPGSTDLHDLAVAIRQTLSKVDGVLQLPRKFKISFSSCGKSCGLPWINDLAFVAVPPAAGADGLTFDVIGAGSLGSHPATGIYLLRAIRVEHVLPVSKAVLKIFAAYGDRQNRAKARLRHIRERLGDAEFLELVRQEFDRELTTSGSVPIRLPPPQRRPWARIGLCFAKGNVPHQAADELARLAWHFDIVTRITPAQEIDVYSSDASSLLGAISETEALRAAVAPGLRTVVCPGAPLCNRAVARTGAMSDAIRHHLDGRAGAIDEALPRVRISGCPNGCAHSVVGQIGLVARVSSVEGKRQEAFDIFVGGGCGRNDKLAACVARGVPAQDIPSAVAGLLERTTPPADPIG